MDQTNTSSETRRFLQHPTELGWEEFVQRYAPRILKWVRARGLKPEACEDLTQEVLVRLYRFMQSYRDQQSFRGWLYTVTLNAIRDYHRSPQTRPQMTQAEFDSNLIVEDDLANYLAERDTLQVALERTRIQAPTTQWQAFETIVLKNQSYDIYSADSGLTKSVLMNYVSQIRKRIADEWQKLNES